jgi:hypothetical protein
MFVSFDPIQITANLPRNNGSKKRFACRGFKATQHSPTALVSQLLVESDKRVDGGSAKRLYAGKVQQDLAVRNQSIRELTEVFAEIAHGFFSEGPLPFEHDVRHTR